MKQGIFCLPPSMRVRSSCEYLEYAEQFFCVLLVSVEAVEVKEDLFLFKDVYFVRRTCYLKLENYCYLPSRDLSCEHNFSRHII